MKYLSIALLVYAHLSGCAHHSDTDTRAAVTEPLLLVLPSQAQTVDWGHLGRAGAAERQPGWVHVLAEKSLNHDLGQRDHPPELERHGSSERTTLRGYSHYELKRWERYCNQGKGMDRRDQEFVRQENYQIPAIMQNYCHPPSSP